MKAGAILAALALVTTAAAPLAQMQHGGKGGHRHAQPYAGQQGREIASLSADEQAGFLDGHGMGLARSAELNGYPGPLHVLELGAALALTPEQRRKVQDVFDRMKIKARELGARYLQAERALDAAFKTGRADAAKVAALVAEANRLLGEVRLAHLAAHVEVKPLLTPEQRARYAQMRGYAGGKHHGGHKH
jgi:Spy/CpxP family protein refolding chaperone